MMMARTMTQGVPEGGAVPGEPEQEVGRQGAVLIQMEPLPEGREEELPPEALLPEALPQEEALPGAEAPDGPGAADITVRMDIVRIMGEGTESPGLITGSWQWGAFF